MNEVDKNELMEQYVSGQLTGESLVAFEEKLTTDEAFRREVALERAIRNNLRAAGRKDWALKLEDFHQEMDLTEEEETPVIPLHQAEASVSKSNYSSKRLFYAIAATILLLLGATYVFTTLSDNVSPNHIFVAYYQPYTSIEQTTRAVPDGNESDRTKGFEFYTNGNYPESVKVFNRVLAKGEDEEVLFYLGNAYLSIDRPQEAEKVFKNYLSKYHEFEAEAKWYLSLSYLKQDKVDEAKPLLEELVKQNSNYRTKATEILESLKKAS